MSQDPNPYEANFSSVPPANLDPANIPISAPWPLTVFGVLFCLFGGWSVLTLPFIFLGIFMQSMFGAGTATGDEAIILQKAQEMANSVMIPSIIIGIFDSLLGLMFVVSGIQILRRKISGADIGSWAIWGCIPIEAGRLALGIYSMTLQMEFMDAPSKQIPDAGGSSAISSIMQASQVFGFILQGLRLLIAIVYLVVAYKVLNHPPHRAYLKAGS